ARPPSARAAPAPARPASAAPRRGRPARGASRAAGYHAAAMAKGGAGLGFRVRTGRAAAVLLHPGSDVPAVAIKREIWIYEKSERWSGQPYHAAMDAPAGEGPPLVKRLSALCARAA